MADWVENYRLACEKKLDRLHDYFADIQAKDVVGGFWIIQVKSREEALEWASRIPGS